MNIKMGRAAIFLLITWNLSAQAARDDDNSTQDENAVRRVARQRLYPGGIDVEALKVQEQLPVIKKDGDNEASPPEPADAD